MEPTLNPIAEVSLIRLIRGSAKANQQILDQLQFFRDILGKLNIGIFIHDLIKLRHIWTNNNFVNFTGYTDSEIKTFGPEWAKDNYHPDDFHIMKERIDYFRQNEGDTYTGIYRVKHKKGHWVWIYSNCTVYKRDEKGIPEQIIGISIDFTASFQTSEQLDELQRENHRLRNQLLLGKLTKRETELLNLVAAGKKDCEIADVMNISVHTAHSHHKNILHKLEMHCNAELTSFAVRCGLHKS